ncbi:MAG: hypothetical protein CL946_04675 [Ectothiorhodospiraceae bacterium]|nr:hypothetical protein [Ectothiorhodospiraceae bacterium]
MHDKQAILQAPLQAHEIDFRVQSITAGGGAIILAYKDARVDMNRLNKAFGVGGWQRKHEVINGNLFCSVGIWNDTIGQWCWVQDVGTESNTEKEKGQASDSFKRACFNLGIGIELYDYPFIFVNLNPEEVDLKTKKPTNKFKLKQWVWTIQHENNQLSFVGAKDQNNVTRYTWGKYKAEKAA